MACSLSCRFAAAEAGLPVTIEITDVFSKDLLNSGGSLLEVNPLGQVATFKTPDGDILTENTAIIVWLMNNAKNEDFYRSAADPTYFQIIRWLSYVGTELHKHIYWNLFQPISPDPVKEFTRGLIPTKFSLLDAHLERSAFLAGEQFTAADCYLAWFLLLTGFGAVDMTPYPNINRYRQTVLSRPNLANVLTKELEDVKLINKGRGMDRSIVVTEEKLFAVV